MSEERLYDLATIAEALGVGRRAARKRATTENWPVHSTEKRRGQITRLYAYRALPRPVQQAIDDWEAAKYHRAKMAEIHAEQMEIAAAAAIKMAATQRSTAEQKEHDRLQRIQEGRRLFGQLPKGDPKRPRAKAREFVIHAVGELRRTTHFRGELQARIEYCERVADGREVLPAWVEAQMPQRHGQRHLVEPTMRKWWYDYRAGGIWALTSNYGNRKGTSKIETNPPLYRVVLGALIQYPQITPASVKEFLDAKHPDLSICSSKAVERFFTRFKAENPQVWTYITNPDKWKNIYMAGVGSVFEHIDRPNQLWELDSTPGDWLLTDGRHSVVGCIDMHTRRVKLFVSKSSTAAAVKQVLRRSMLDWGIPEAVRTDNGKDYVSEDVTSLLRDLEIKQEICIPFASEEKGTIERFFRTMSHGILNLLDGFIGHNVAERKAIEARKSFAQRIMKKDAVVEVQMSSDQLQQKLDEWVAFYYEQRPHSGLKKQSPIEVWRAWNQPLRQITEYHALDELMAEVGGTRVIGKKGIRYDNRLYLDPQGVMHEHVGQEVVIRLDEQDVGRLAIYLDGAFLCWAIDPDAQGIERREVATAIKSHVKKRVAEQAAELKEFTKSIKQDIVQTVIDHRKAQVENIVDLPKRTESYSTPALEAGSEAVRSRAQLTQKSDVTPVDEEQHAALVAEFARQAEVVEIADDPMSAYRYWSRLQARLEAGRQLTREERDGLELYWSSEERRSMDRYFKSFGLDPLVGLVE
jgi:hypothetical protein